MAAENDEGDDRTDGTDTAPAAGEDPAPRRRGRPPGSRLDAFREYVGRESDSAVARRAGVSRETVRQFRLRHGIPAGTGDGDAPREEQAAPRQRATPRKAAAPADADRPRRRGPRSPIDQHAELLGTMPDSEIARRAGVTPAAVAQYRRNRNIAPFSARGEDGGAGKRRGRPPVRPPVQAEADATPGAETPATESPAAEAPEPRRAQARGRSYVFMVTLQRRGAEERFAVVARDVGEAARLAMEGAGGAEVTAMERQLTILG